MKKSKSTNLELLNLINFLKKQSKAKEAKIWLTLARQLSKPRRNRAAVNLGCLNRNTQERDTVVVPGKVLGAGLLDHKITVAAFDISEKAKEKIAATKANYLTIPELIEKNPKGAKVKIIR